MFSTVDHGGWSSPLANFFIISALQGLNPSYINKIEVSIKKKQRQLTDFCENRMTAFKDCMFLAYHFTDLDNKLVPSCVYLNWLKNDLITIVLIYLWLNRIDPRNTAAEHILINFALMVKPVRITIKLHTCRTHLLSSLLLSFLSICTRMFTSM